jgi:hypothetical protein
MRPSPSLASPASPSLSQIPPAPRPRRAVRQTGLYSAPTISHGQRAQQVHSAPPPPRPPHTLRLCCSMSTPSRGSPFSACSASCRASIAAYFSSKRAYRASRSARSTPDSCRRRRRRVGRRPACAHTPGLRRGQAGAGGRARVGGARAGPNSPCPCGGTMAPRCRNAPRYGTRLTRPRGTQAGPRSAGTPRDPWVSRARRC